MEASKSLRAARVWSENLINYIRVKKQKSDWRNIIITLQTIEQKRNVSTVPFDRH